MLFRIVSSVHPYRMVKAAAFVCVIALGTFLIVTADTDSERELPDNGDSDGIPTLAPRENSQMGHNDDENKEDESASPDDGDSLEVSTTKAPRRTSPRGSSNKKNKEEETASSDDGESLEVSTTKAPRRTSPRGSSNKKNKDDESVLSGDSDLVDILTTKTPRRASPRGSSNKKNKDDGSASPDDGDSVVSSTTKTPRRAPPRGSSNKKNKGNLNEPTGVLLGHNMMSREATTDDNPTCSSPPEIEGTIGPRAKGTEHEVGTSVTYNCNFGYVSRNSITHISTCTFNETTGKAEWTVPELTCIPRSCGDPGYVSNARRIGNLFTFPNKVEYECEEGYKMRGLRDRYCQAGGDWSGRLPICEQIYCSVPPDPENGRVRYSSLEYGTELRYECNAGFLLKKHEPRFCMVDGKWSNDEPECTEARCEVPPPIEHGTVRLSGEPKVGSLATYFCNPGKMLFGASTTKCLITGQWTFDPPKCISFCYVPDVENGEIGQFEDVVSRWRTVKEFKKFSTGTQVNHNATLLLRCNRDYLPTDDSPISKNNQLEVTCHDGTWSKSFRCKTTDCLSEPPEIENGKAVINSRKHGATIWYNCSSKKHIKVSGQISCQFGEWDGYTPKCFDSPCNTSALNFRGLVKPQEERLSSMKSLDVVCEIGFTKAPSAEKVTCIKGKWDITESPCIDLRENDGTTAVRPEETVAINEHKVGPESLNQPTDECTCTYGYSRYNVRALSRGKVLQEGDTVKRGETVSLECTATNRVLSWQNGLRLYGKANMTCSECKKWESIDLPDCKFHQEGNPLILYEGKILPGGVTEIKIREVIRLYCVSMHAYPIWYFNGNPVISQTRYAGKDATTYYADMEVTGTVDQHYAKYDCYIEGDAGDSRRRSSTLELLLKAPCSTRELNFPGLIKPAEDFLSESFDIVCENGYIKAPSAEKVTCIEGRWNIIQNPCIDHRCFTSELNYPGLIKPSREFFLSFENFDIRCRNGFRMSSLKRIITCVGGKWDVTEDPCYRVREHDDATAVRPETTVNEHKVGPESSNQPTDECTCTYGYSRNNVRALSIGKVLQKGDTVRRGETVSFECTTTHGVLSWENGLRLYGKANMICSECNKWGSRDLPDCKFHQEGHPLIFYLEKILPGGAAEIKEGEVVRFYCGSTFDYPVWYFNGYPVRSQTKHSDSSSQRYYTYMDLTGRYDQHNTKYDCYIVSNYASRAGNTTLELLVKVLDIRCPPIDGIGIFTVYYDNDRRINSTAQILCKEDGKRVEGCAVATCLPNATWSGSYPECVDYVSCPKFLSLPGLIISYSKGYSVGSRASFSCSPANTLVGSSYSICQNNGTWNHPSPKCEEITCPMFSDDDGLSVTYDNFNRMGSWATFACSENRKLIGERYSRCQNNGTWSKIQPYCEELSCSIGDLATSVPEGVVPDMTGVTGEFMPPGSEMLLECEKNLIPNGNSKAICRNDGGWELKNFQCVSGCILEKDPSSHLLVQPMKESYRFGESILLSCPPGEEITSDVERLVCFGNGWSDTIPDCKEAEESISRGP